MKKHIYDEGNGLSYTLHGDYYLPDLAVNEEEPTYGKYGMLRKQFLKEHRPAQYQYCVERERVYVSRKGSRKAALWQSKNRVLR